MPGHLRLRKFFSSVEVLLLGAEEIAAGFSSHFKDLASPTPNESFDSEYFRQVQYDALVIEDLCSRQVGCTFKPVETAEIFSTVRSFRNGKAHGTSMDYLQRISNMQWRLWLFPSPI